MRMLTALCLMLWAAPLAAHPHVFIDTELHLVTGPDGHLAGVEVVWTYDELYSLLVLEDMGLDGDYDGVLTPEELGKLNGFDMQWIDGFAGDLYASRDGAAVALGAPDPRGTSFADGKITTRHFRAIAAENGVGALVLKAFDPTYYTAYDLQGRVTVPEGCGVQITPANLDEAYTKVEEALYVNPPEEDDDYPEVGEAFADTVLVSCAR